MSSDAGVGDAVLGTAERPVPAARVSAQCLLCRVPAPPQSAAGQRRWLHDRLQVSDLTHRETLQGSGVISEPVQLCWVLGSHLARNVVMLWYWQLF